MHVGGKSHEREGLISRFGYASEKRVVGEQSFKSRAGIVNLTAVKPADDTRRRYHSRPSDLRPQAHRRCAQFAMMVGGDVVARDVKQVGDRVMDGDEALQMSP